MDVRIGQYGIELFTGLETVKSLTVYETEQLIVRLKAVVKEAKKNGEGE